MRVWVDEEKQAIRRHASTSRRELIDVGSSSSHSNRTANRQFSLPEIKHKFSKQALSILGTSLGTG
jgi:hypothetical protein